MIALLGAPRLELWCIHRYNTACDLLEGSSKNCSGIPSASFFPKAPSRAFCRRRGSSIRCASARRSFSATAPKIKEAAAHLNVSLEGVRIINPAESEDLPAISRNVSKCLRRSKGMQEKEAREAMLQPNYFGAMMVAMHQADG